MPILNGEGVPLPNTEILSRLQRIHPNLGLRFMPRWDGTRWWALTWEWERHDPRFRFVHEGTINPADTFDIVAELPYDCSPDEAYGYAVNGLKRFTREDVRNLSYRAHEYNKTAHAGVVDEAVEQAVETFAPTETAKKAAAHKGPKSFGGIEKRGRKAKS
jgi:hypothetical protein